ncbi:MAG: ABC transporter permease [Clostridia bacterium]|nr:ABC transporter permease [Clostridia bacterium]
MTVFKYFFKVLNSYKFFIILTTVLLVGFGCFSLKTNDTTTNFVANEPTSIIINEDGDNDITKNLCEYIKKNSTIKEINTDEDSINDAIFYRQVSYAIYIPNNYGEDFLKGSNPEIKIKATGDSNSAYMKMLLERYIKIVNIYQQEGLSESEIIQNANRDLEKNIEVEMTSKINANSLSQSTFFYNFANYSLLAGCVFIVAMVLSSFRNRYIRKRTIVSSTKYTSFNKSLFLANAIFALALWAIYVIISILLVKDVMLSLYGILYMINSFVFTICCLSIAFLIGNVISNKDGINGIVNVLALGSSFLCGAFVPVEFLPSSVLTIAHILPSYWYIQNNQFISTLETINFHTLKPYLVNLTVIVLFIIGFIVLTNIITKHKRKEN